MPRAGVRVEEAAPVEHHEAVRGRHWITSTATSVTQRATTRRPLTNHSMVASLPELLRTTVQPGASAMTKPMFILATEPYRFRAERVLSSPQSTTDRHLP